MRLVEMSQEILTAAVVFFTFDLFYLTNSLQCWQCSTRISVRELREKLEKHIPFECGDPFLNTSNTFVDNCDSRASGLHRPLCRKRIERSNNIVIYTRSCDLNPDEYSTELELGNRNGREYNDPQQTKCISSPISANGDFSDDCWCSHDRCNSFETQIIHALNSGSTKNRSIFSMVFIMFIVKLVIFISHELE